MDAIDDRKVVTCDIPGAFLQADWPADKDCFLKFENVMVDMICHIDPKYKKNVIYRGKKKIIYAKLTKAVYGTLLGAILFYEKLSKQLIEWGYVQNNYDACTFNKVYITYYLKAAALLLNVLERQRVSSRPADYSILTISYAGTSPNLSAMTCCSTSSTVLALLVDLLFPNFVYIFVINGVFLYVTVFVALALLDDLFFWILLYTLVSGLSDILFDCLCFRLGIFLETFVFAGLFAVKCCHIGLLLSFANSFTFFIL